MQIILPSTTANAKRSNHVWKVAVCAVFFSHAIRYSAICKGVLNNCASTISQNVG